MGTPWDVMGLDPLVARGCSLRPINARKWIATLISLAAGPLVGHAAEVDTQFIFGFTMGADVGERGEKEVELEPVGRFGKRDGPYTVLENQLRAEFTPTENFRFEIGVPVALSRHRRCHRAR
jgi:hypothetical protein